MRAAGASVLALLVSGCGEPATPLLYEAVGVERRDIVVSAEAAGVVEPDITVEVKSKASGEILELLVETGDLVEEGTLLVRIDQRQPRNTLAQAEAELEVARARLANAESEWRRAKELFDTQSISEAAYDRAVLERANARANRVRAEVEVENARIQMDDTDVRAPIRGTIIEKSVERGQVISSPTRDVAGGTTLLRMADLDQVRVRTLVDETDIGKVRPGLEATVTVAAYPERPFPGSVLKIEPQSVTQQNVTMFPVLVRVENREGLLRPGMNCEVEIHVGGRENVLAVPYAALRTPQDVGAAAAVIGLSERAVRQKLASEVQARRAQRGDGGAPTAAGVRVPARRGARYIVFVVRNRIPEPVFVRTGITDLDYAEVLGGLSESDAVLVLPSASLARSQEEFRDRVNRRMGLPGLRSPRR